MGFAKGRAAMDVGLRWAAYALKISQGFSEGMQLPKTR